MDKNTETFKTVHRLMKRYKKYQIKQFTGATWQTVHMWSLGVNDAVKSGYIKELRKMERMKTESVLAVIQKKKELARK